ncbi:hypothetical protein NIES4071_12230 [Calothrix sp. NIES-4071]|nr:hypothetical protein NIES4071_12230 [Calothrix sp. NIES-4071]BAZ55563.1 hypothetical protein NIES4105_12190 [Calothrix sp. NIES-4105]
MLKSKLFKKLRATLFELWLPIPLFAVACWGLSGIVMYVVLNRSLLAPKYLIVEPKAKLPTQIIVAALPLKVAPSAIFVEVDKNKGISRVKVKTKNTPMTEVVYEFPTTDENQLLSEISKALGMSREDTKNLIKKY